MPSTAWSRSSVKGQLAGLRPQRRALQGDSPRSSCEITLGQELLRLRRGVPAGRRSRRSRRRTRCADSRGRTDGRRPRSRPRRSGRRRSRPRRRASGRAIRTSGVPHRSGRSAGVVPWAGIKTMPSTLRSTSDVTSCRCRSRSSLLTASSGTVRLSVRTSCRPAANSAKYGLVIWVSTTPIASLRWVRSEAAARL